MFFKHSFSGLAGARLANLALIVAIVAPVSASAQTVISACETTLVGEGVLTANLDCGFEEAVIMGEGSVLNLAGFTLTGDLRCVSDCRLKGPGALYGSVLADNSLDGDEEAFVSDGAEVHGAVRSYTQASVDGATVYGFVWGGKVVGLRNAIVRDSLTTGVSAFEVTATNSTVTGHDDVGVLCTKCSLLLSTVSNNGEGVACDRSLYKRGKVYSYSSDIDSNVNYGVNCGGKSTLIGGSLHDNAWGVLASETDINGKAHGKARLENVSVQGGWVGVLAERADIRSSDISGAGFAGVAGRRAKLRSSSVHDNGIDAGCGGSVFCADLRTSTRPNVSDDSTCGTSLDDAGVTWGVCSND